MSLLSRFFGGGGGGEASSPASIEHEGFTITPEPIADGSQFRLAARITREVDSEMKEHHLIRADTLGSKDQAEEAAVNKAKQLIDQMGLRLFD